MRTVQMNKLVSRSVVVLLLGWLVVAPAWGSAWTYVGTGPGVESNTTSATVTVPAGTQPGDLLLLGCQGRANAHDWSATGFTSLAYVNSLGGLRMEVLSRLASDPVPTSVSVSNVSGTNGWSCEITTFRGAASAALEASPAMASGSTATMTAPAATTVSSDALVARFFASMDDNTHANPSTGQLAFSRNALIGVDHAASMSFAIQASPGSTGTSTMQETQNAADGWYGLTLVFTPGSTGGNNPPSISSVSDSPDPVLEGQAVQFAVNWSDADGNSVRAIVCKTDAVNAGATPTCPGGAWAGPSALSGVSPVGLSYTAASGDIGTNNYYAFVCDDPSGSCSSASDPNGGTFTVNQAGGGGGSWTHVGTGALASTPNATSLNVSYPPGISAGDLILLGCQGRANDQDWSASGFTSLVRTTSPGGLRLEILYAWASGGESGTVPVTNVTGLNGWSCEITALRGGVGSGNPLDVAVATNSGTGSTMTAPAVVTATGGALATRWYASGDDHNHGNPSSGTLAFGGTSYDTTDGVDHAASMSYMVQATAGNSGTATMQQQTAGSYNAWAAVTLAFKPGAGGGGNHPPAISSVSDSPDPVNAGQGVQFVVNWADADGNSVRAIVCKTDTVSAGTTPSCPGGAWAGPSALSGSSPINLSYTTTSGDIGTNNYYAFVCDDPSGSCSPASNPNQGTFTVEEGPPPEPPPCHPEIGCWYPSITEAAYVIAASNSSATAKARADVVVTGTADDEINAALNVVSGQGGGNVLLLGGQYDVANPIVINSAGVGLVGENIGNGLGYARAAIGSMIAPAASFPNGVPIIQTGSGADDVILALLHVDGLGRAGGIEVSSKRPMITITGITSVNGNALHLAGAATGRLPYDGLILFNRIFDNEGDGIVIESSAGQMLIEGNIVFRNGGNGFENYAPSQTYRMNHGYNNTGIGLHLAGSTSLTRLNSNKWEGNGQGGVYIDNVNAIMVEGDTFAHNGSTNAHLRVRGSDVTIWGILAGKGSDSNPNVIRIISGVNVHIGPVASNGGSTGPTIGDDTSNANIQQPIPNLIVAPVSTAWPEVCDPAVDCWYPAVAKASYILAAPDSTAEAKARADVVVVGTANDEINAALNAQAALGGGNVLLLAGRYDLANPIVMQGHGLGLIGETVGNGLGHGQTSLGTMIAPAAGFPSGEFLVQSPDADGSYGPLISLLYIDGMNSAQGIYVRGQRPTISLNAVTRSSGSGIRLHGVDTGLRPYDGYVLFNRVFNNNGHGVFHDQNSGDMLVEGNVAFGNGGNGFESRGASQKFHKNHAYGNAGVGLHLIPGSARVRLNENVWESNSQGGVHIDGISAVTIVGDRFASNGSTNAHLRIEGSSVMVWKLVAGKGSDDNSNIIHIVSGSGHHIGPIESDNGCTGAAVRDDTGSASFYGTIPDPVEP